MMRRTWQSGCKEGADREFGEGCRGWTAMEQRRCCCTSPCSPWPPGQGHEPAWPGDIVLFCAWAAAWSGLSSGSATVRGSPQIHSQTPVRFPWLSCLTISLYLNISSEERFFFLSGWLCTLARESLTRPLQIFIFLLHLPYHKFHH